MPCSCVFSPPMQDQSTQLPHVSECNYCMRCSSDVAPAIALPKPMSSDSVFQEMFPSRADSAAKQLKPNCTDCRGCSTQLQPLKAMVAFGQDSSVEVGASPEWIFATGEDPGWDVRGRTEQG